MTKLIKIGNSYGIRIPKALVQQANLENHPIELKLSRNGLLLSPSINRASWDSETLRQNAEKEQGFCKEMQDFLNDDLNTESWEW